MRSTKNLRKGTKYFVSDQYPPEINERRRVLQKIRKEKKNEGRQVRLVADRLYIDGELHTNRTARQVDNDTFNKAMNIEIASSEKFSENGNTYQGHAIQIADIKNCKAALMQLFKDPSIATALHNPWVFKNNTSSTRDDNGVYGDSYRIADTLNQHSANRCMIVVSIWSKSQQKSADRFHCIEKATKLALTAGDKPA